MPVLVMKTPGPNKRAVEPLMNEKIKNIRNTSSKFVGL
jgi:ribosomal protein S17E